MNYWARYSLEYNPFLKNSKEEIVLTSTYKEAIARLNLLETIKGFGVLTGAAGLGKTTVVRKWTDAMSPAVYKVVYIPLSTITTMEFYKNMALQFGLEPEYRKYNNFQNIQNQINYLTLEKHITPVIVLDEADALNASILCDLKMLFNFERDSKDRAIVVLVGLPSLNNTLNRNANEALRQRIISNYNMEPLSKEEAAEYIKQRLKSAGGNEETFTPQALNAIENAASGTIRMIHKICNNCLLIADSQKATQVNEDIALQAISDIQLG